MNDEYYVIFATVKRDRFLKRLLKPGFGTAAVCKKQGDKWVAINVYESHMDTFILPGVTHRSIRENGHIALHVERDSGYEHSKRVHLGMTPIRCAAVTKLYLGISAWYVWTPHQLYKYLKSGRAKKYGLRLIEEIR